MRYVHGKDSMSPTIAGGDVCLCVINKQYSAADLKAILGCMDAIVASRFHSAVGGLSKSVPTLVIGWAHKYHSLMKRVKQEQYALDYRNLQSREVIATFNTLWTKRTHIHEILSEVVPTIKKDAEQPIIVLKEMM